MIVITRDGSFVPSKLHTDLAAANVAVFGVTATEADTQVTAVQVICADGTDPAAIDAVIAGQPTPEHLAALAQLRMIRDRWLAQTDYIEVYLASPAAFTPLPQPIQNAINTNSAAWIAWRQALRDMPAQAGLDPVAATVAISKVHASTDTFPPPWPQPPAAPVIHLT